MKRIAVVAVVCALLLAGTAFAEDGFKAYVGYSVGYQNNKTSEYLMGSFTDSVTTSGLTHGPNVDLRYEGDFFVRGTFDYLMGASNKAKFSFSSDKISKDVDIWSAEGNVGYRVYKGNGVSLYPYIGFGYMEIKEKEKDTGFWFKTSTPYGVAGGLLKYDQAQWSAGIDVAVLVPFEGTWKNSVGNKIDLSVGLGGRVQLPVTYTIMQQKAGGVGIMLFGTPYFQYLDTFKSEKWMDVWKIRNENYQAGIKAGIGFSF
jgi:hypothetical protein